MKEKSWIEVRQEYDISDTGEYVLKKVSKEPERVEFARKDKIDLIFRVISLVSIGIPIVLLFLQQKASLHSQKALQQYEVYATASLELHSILRRSVYDPAFNKSQDRLSYELTPKIEFLYSKDVSHKANEVNDIIVIYKAIINNDNIEDSLYQYENDAGSYLGSFKDADDKTIIIEDEFLNILHQMDSTYREISFSENALYKLSKEDLFRSKEVVSILSRAINLDSAFSFFHANFNDLSQNIRNACDHKKNNNTHGLQKQFISIDEETQKLITFRPEMVDSFKAVRQSMTKNLKLQIDSLQYSLKEANQFLADN